MKTFFQNYYLTFMKKITVLLICLLTVGIIWSQEIPKKEQKKRPTLVKIETTMGDIKIKLYDETPKHKQNFLLLVKNGSYKGLLFHRVIKDFMIQGGDPESRNCDSTQMLGRGDMDYTLPAEINFPQLYHKRGVLAAARKDDNINPNRESSAIQFYIVTGRTYTDAELTDMELLLNEALLPPQPLHYNDEQRMNYRTFGGAPHLDGRYTVFGEVIEGYNVLEAIQAVETNNNDRPKKDVRIINMKVVKR